MKKTIHVSGHPRKVRGRYTYVTHYNKTITARIKAKKKGIITQEHKPVFTLLSKQPREYGGELDFDRTGKLERYTTEIGHKKEVTVPDFEATWHTHPPFPDSPYIQSPDDIYWLLKSNLEQASLVMQDGKSVVISKTNKSKKWYKDNKKDALNKLKQFFKQADNEANRWLEDKLSTNRQLYNLSDKQLDNLSKQQMYKSYAKKLENIGLLVTFFPKTSKTIIIPIKPYEPKEGRVRGSVSYSSLPLYVQKSEEKAIRMLGLNPEKEKIRIEIRKLNQLLHKEKRPLFRYEIRDKIMNLQKSTNVNETLRHN